ncbi:hypothetical protein H0178_28625 [Cytobacillus firmus]|uniref:hypothetical protein n=1 Tax=Paenibacillus lautus TaxID=1401 RepID=UPI00384D806E|nr:hypothetical protein [Cytobacillus firmus]
MKVAFHFNADHPSVNSKIYGVPFHRILFSSLLQYRALNISTKVFIGDLLLSNLAYEYHETSTGMSGNFNKEKYLEIINDWVFTGNNIWRRFSYDRIEEVVRSNIFAICFENIDYDLAEYLHIQLKDYLPYLGAIEVDDASELHWELYSHSLSSKYRIINENLNMFWDGFSEDSKDYGWFDFLEKCGFKKVEFESLEGKYSIFDKYHNFKHARRIAEWKKRSSNFLAYLSDNVVTRLSDAAPELGNKLWSAFKTFDEAETEEQYAQVAASCRRIIEYIADTLFPPTDEEPDGRKLQGKHYKNRLLAYADAARKSETNIDVVIASTNLLSEQIDKLVNLVNKGIHAEVYREEARRCLIRTIMLLDDLISLKKDPFKIKSFEL